MRSSVSPSGRKGAKSLQHLIAEIQNPNQSNTHRCVVVPGC